MVATKTAVLAERSTSHARLEVDTPTGRSSPATPPTVELPTDEHGVLVLQPSGDLVLSIKDADATRNDIRFRVSTAKLRAASPYFRLLLDPQGFEEGRRIASVHAGLHGQALDRVPSSLLPSVTIEDIGRISQIKSPHLLLADVLRLLHGQDLAAIPPPVSNLANLTIVADRFDALSLLRQYIHAKRVPQLIDVKLSRTKTTTTSEERLRQRCLIGVHLQHGSWLLSASQSLIQRSALQPPPSPTAQPAWTDLPSGIEEELLHRRLYLLDTLQSIQAWFLAQYTSRTRQCKLGYDSSAACDSYQLGEMVRFFSRTGILSLAGTLVDLEDAEGPQYDGDIRDIIDRLRRCPEYQVDANHRHCGLRTRMLPLLDVVEKALDDSGICLDCWTNYRGEYAWSEAKRPVTWTREGAIKARGNMEHARPCLEKHLMVRDMCMARERVWDGPGHSIIEGRLP